MENQRHGLDKDKLDMDAVPVTTIFLMIIFWQEKTRRFIMKSYIQGLITGAVLIFAFMVLIGAKSQQVGRFQFMGKYTAIIDTATGDIYTDGKISHPLELKE